MRPSGRRAAARRRTAPIAPTVETTARPPSQPKPAALTLAGSRSPPASAAEREASRAAPVHTSVLSASGADARGDALRAEDVRAVDDRRRQPERGAERVERRRAAPASTSTRPVEASASATAVRRLGALAAEGDGGDRDDHREGVDEQREQRGVEPLERGEVAAGLARRSRRRRARARGRRRGAQRAQRGRRRAERRAATAARPRARSGSRAACRPSRPRRRRACRRSPSRRRRRRRRGRGAAPGMAAILPPSID